MQTRNMIMTASMGFFVGVILWGIQIILFHFNSLLPPTQSLQAYHLEKLEEGSYRVEIFGESFGVRLPVGEKIITCLKSYIQKIPVKNLTNIQYEIFEEIKDKGSQIVITANKKLESLKQTAADYTNSFLRALNFVIDEVYTTAFNFPLLTSHVDTLYI